MSNTRYFRFRSNSIPVRLSVMWLLLCLTFTILASWIANDLPVYARVNGQSVFPAISPHRYITIRNAEGDAQIMLRDIDWKNNTDAFIIWPLVTYSAGSIDMQNTGFVSPFKTQHIRKGDSVEKLPVRFRHWLGTTQTGRDVLSGTIYGTRISLTVGIMSMLIAGIIGISLGAISGYTSDSGLKISRGVLLSVTVGIIPACFYAFNIRWQELQNALQQNLFQFILSLTISLFIFLGILFLFVLAGKLLKKLNLFRPAWIFPVDMILSRVVEVFSSLPKLILIITLSAVTKPSLLNLVLIVGFTGWTDIARIVRAEMLKIKSSDYIQLACAQGIRPLRIVIRHALPNVVRPALVTMIFGIGTVILIESSLSFLGIGVPFETVTWGSLIASGKENLDAWWLVVFPGLCIFFTVASLNILSDAVGVDRH